ncbi:MAG: DUF4428 domain-containing protein [Clostridiaceae bacterium]|nr:DUF4428 domain-containing protein [Clostridiaceae bacterium]
MGLFTKKPPCPICGGKISWFLPSKVEGEYICDTCNGKIDMDDDKKNNLTMQVFKDYLVFFDQNQSLKDKFVISEKIDFGLWDTKIIFDYENKLFCMSNNPDKTIFEGNQLKYFLIKEDSTPLFEGSPEEIIHYDSSVPERAIALAPQINQFMMNQQLNRTIDRLDDGKINSSAPTQYHNINEPFKAFNIELHFDHPYWTVISCDMSGPTFSNSHPSITNYLSSYQQNIEEIEKLVNALKEVAFPNAIEKSIAFGSESSSARSVNPTFATTVDSIEEIKKYKALMDEGIISQEEFDAKKKQLLGI